MIEPQKRPAIARPGHVPAKRNALVYACSGCSTAAQMANRIALWMDAAGEAEMSCIAGVGGGVTGLVRTARSGRPIIALDGCVMHCVSACLSRAGVSPSLHLTLSEFGVAKRKHREFDPAEAERIYRDEVLPRARDILRTSLAGD